MMIPTVPPVSPVPPLTPERDEDYDDSIIASEPVSIQRPSGRSVPFRVARGSPPSP